ncbi:hypothetical protein FDW83_09625 [Pseudarthrobacter sp. NamE2]|uniref:hypothetical protein n=1 Tax=Pseudarthrobacter sp. NamE2 TaxID=2576838 RepID=UPI0010FE82F4|nr:hypothetical protein [Pseudarthrobacter sp. NamE2]TLM83699.1 hypothetical protein FDW83_09625 [Pseudarthrobacter sp. NamE2]
MNVSAALHEELEYFKLGSAEVDGLAVEGDATGVVQAKAVVRVVKNLLAVHWDRDRETTVKMRNGVILLPKGFKVTPRQHRRTTDSLLVMTPGL